MWNAYSNTTRRRHHSLHPPRHIKASDTHATMLIHLCYTMTICSRQEIQFTQLQILCSIWKEMCQNTVLFFLLCYFFVGDLHKLSTSAQSLAVTSPCYLRSLNITQKIFGISNNLLNAAWRSHSVLSPQKCHGMERCFLYIYMSHDMTYCRRSRWSKADLLD